MAYHYTKFLLKYEQQCLPAINYIVENKIKLPVLAGSNLNVKDLVKYHSAFMTFAKKHPTLDENQVIFDLFFKGLGPKFWEALEENYFKNTLNMQNIIEACTLALNQNPYLLIYMEWPSYCFQRYYDKFIMCQHKCKTTQMDIPVKSFIDGIDRNRPYRNPKLVKALTDVYQNGTLTMENAVEKCREIIDEDPCILQYYNSWNDTLQSYTERFLQHQRKSGKSMNEICRSYIDGFQPAEEMLHARLVKKFPSGTNIASLNIIEKSILEIIGNNKDLFELCKFDTENFSISKCQSETTTTKPTVALDCFHGSRCLACAAKGNIQSLREYYDINETDLNEAVLIALQCSKNVSTGDAKGDTSQRPNEVETCSRGKEQSALVLNSEIIDTNDNIAMSVVSGTNGKECNIDTNDNIINGSKSKTNTNAKSSFSSDTNENSDDDNSSNTNDAQHTLKKCESKHNSVSPEKKNIEMKKQISDNGKSRQKRKTAKGNINETELNEEVPNALQCSKNVSTGDAKGANTNAKSSFMKTCLKKKSEAKSMQEISGNAKKKRKHVVKPLPQLFIDEEEKIYAMLATRDTGNYVKKKIFFEDFSRDLYNGILRRVHGIGKKWSKDDRLEVKGRLLAANNYAKVKALAIKATERDVQKV
eukprot:g14584.t1